MTPPAASRAIVASESARRSRSTCSVCCARSGGGRSGMSGVARHLQRHVHLRHAAGERVRQVEFHAARAQLRIGEHLVELVDRSARHAHCFQRREPLALRALRDGLRDHGHQDFAVPDAVFVARKALVARPFRTAGDLAELRELAVVSDCQDEMAVRACEHLVRDDVLVRVARTAGRRAGHQMIHPHHGHHRHRGIEECQVEPLTLRRCGRDGQVRRGSPRPHTCRS